MTIYFSLFTHFLNSLSGALARTVRQRLWIQYSPYSKKRDDGKLHDDSNKECNLRTNSLLSRALYVPFDLSCDVDMVFDVMPKIDCGESGMGMMLRLGTSGKLEEYCAMNGPFVRNYRIELVMGHPYDEFFKSTNYVKSQMSRDGYQIANFDAVSRREYMNGALVARRSLRQRIWVQPDFRMRPLRNIDTLDEIIEEDLENDDSREISNVCRDQLGIHDKIEEAAFGERFTIGQRVEIYYKGTWHPGTVVRKYTSEKGYSVQVDTETGIVYSAKNDKVIQTNMEWCEVHCSFEENKCVVNEDKEDPDGMCPKCWWSQADKSGKDVEAIEVFNVKAGVDGQYSRDDSAETLSYIKGTEFAFLRTRNGEWILRDTQGNVVLKSKSIFESTPITVKKWMTSDIDGQYKVKYESTVVESRNPIPSHNRHHWCEIARRGTARAHVFELEREGASTEKIEEAEQKFEDLEKKSSHLEEKQMVICWAGNPEVDGCDAFHKGRGVGIVAWTTTQNMNLAKKRCESSLNDMNARCYADYLDVRSTSDRGGVSECAKRCKSTSPCRFFAFDSQGVTCRLYVVTSAELKNPTTVSYFHEIPYDNNEAQTVKMVDPTDLDLIPGPVYVERKDNVFHPVYPPFELFELSDSRMRVGEHLEGGEDEED